MSEKSHRDFSLFPHSEEWGSGDEAMDMKLTHSLKNAIENLSFDEIENFYFEAVAQKPRVFNPSFGTTIEFVTKALLYNLHPNEFNNHLFMKLKGQYFKREKILFHFPEAEKILDEMKYKNISRYGGQVDFSLHAQNILERNPYLKVPLTRSPWDLHVKIIFKDFKHYLSGKKDNGTHPEALFHALRRSSDILFIENFGELWYHQDQIFSFTKLI